MAATLNTHNCSLLTIPFLSSFNAVRWVLRSLRSKTPSGLTSFCPLLLQLTKLGGQSLRCIQSTCTSSNRKQQFPSWNASTCLLKLSNPTNWLLPSILPLNIYSEGRQEVLPPATTSLRDSQWITSTYLSWAEKLFALQVYSPQVLCNGLCPCGRDTCRTWSCCPHGPAAAGTLGTWEAFNYPPFSA